MLDNPWAYTVDPNKQPRYQPVVDCTYWTLLFFFNNWNIVQFTNKTTSSEDFYAVHKVVIDDISDNLVSLVQLGKYGAINASDPNTMGYYVINYLSESYTLQEHQTSDGKVSKSGEFLVKSEYLSLMK